MELLNQVPGVAIGVQRIQASVALSGVGVVILRTTVVCQTILSAYFHIFGTHEPTIIFSQFLIGTGCQAAYGSCTGTGGGGGEGGGGTTPPPTGGRPRPGSVPYGQIISSCTQNGVVALTFDDGPYMFANHL